jgi:hypothetical protein
MNSPKPFGRRSNPQPPPRDEPKLDAPTPRAAFLVAVAPDSPSPILHREILLPPVDDEFLRRQQPAQRPFKMPWRQLSLMAALCFGIASFVLPESVNDQLDWVLYGLMALSAYAGMSKRFFGS